MISCVVVDDEQHAIEVLTNYIDKTPFLELKFTSSDPLEAIHLIQQQSIELVFLDIQMPDLTGIQFLKILGEKCKYILTTAYPEYALEGYEYAVVDYLLKPISFDRFLKAAQKALNLLTSNLNEMNFPKKENDFILVKAGVKGKMIKINLGEIIYIEGLKNYVSIYTIKERIVAYLNIKDLDRELNSEDFLRVHKSYIVALNKIEGIEGNQIIISDSHKPSKLIPIGGTYKNSLFAFLEDKIL